ncbi:hypothetical protein C5H24_11065 [Xylella fastidiosa]|nr:hypothetical protein [Xylella fastidiosa]TNV90819.1 hypothetical protein C5H25_11010 [Xylella fastidiosa]TNW01344.1 hypothetical protein C5H24_11065 [Xylella fastidiosa]TNW08357.1 hypothetical protein C5H16_10855 [Xylella fastidiosa]TNW14350.1 hypothetical protein C5H15_11115 [Xylella fastidiosa]TNW18663.1 hypothetical protein C5H12_10695 [Xylella fastidiosa]
MLDLRPIFRNSRFAQRVQVLRCHGQYLADGTWQQEYFLDTVLAIIHPVTPDDVQLLPEGQRYFPSKKIMSQHALCVGDLVRYQDTTWRIVQLSDWSEYGYYHGIAVRHDGTAQPAAAASGLT